MVLILCGLQSRVHGVTAGAAGVLKQDKASFGGFLLVKSSLVNFIYTANITNLYYSLCHCTLDLGRETLKICFLLGLFSKLSSILHMCI